jgi:maleylpyruvate isomerase
MFAPIRPSPTIPNCIVCMPPHCHVADTVAAVAERDQRAISSDVDDVLASHVALIEHLRGLDPVEPNTPSRLPGWSVGHVLTHIARNADGIVSVMNGQPQDPHGLEGRNGDIETGSTRSWSDLVDDVEHTCAAVDEVLGADVEWSGTVTMLSGERPKDMVPFLRLREVEVHHSDLGLGYDFGDMPARYLRKELGMMEMLWRARKPMGMTPLPDAALALPPPTRLAWMMGRIDVDELSPAGLF